MTSRKNIVNFFIGLGLGAILVFSYFLTPDPRGFGTHEHLFLPPCFFKFFFNLPCPACGLTTSFAYLAKGQWAAGFHNHWMSPLLFLLFAFLFLYALYCLFRGKTFWDLFQNKWMPRLSSVLILGILACWIIKLFPYEKLSP